MADNKQIAADVLEAVGGKSNVSFVTHCMTRLRFTLKDRTQADPAVVKKLNGVLGAQESGGQFQIIIGQNVPKVYDELCKLGGFTKQAAIDENLDAPQEHLTLKSLGGNILNYVSGSITPMIPVLLCAGLFKTVGAVAGPTMLNLVSDTSDFVVLMNMFFSAAFYFMPIYLGYFAARQIGLTPALGAFMGGLLIEPTFMSLATEGASFSIFGIPCAATNYSQTVLPILLTVPVMYFLEKGFRKILPTSLTTIFTPFLTVLVTVPVSFCLLAPIGSWAGNALAALFEALGTSGGIAAIIGAGLLAAIWLPIVITGMHMAIIAIAMANFAAVGSDSYILVASTMASFACFGLEFASYCKLRDKKEKEMCLGYLISQYIGGVGEPFIYGVLLRYPRLFIAYGIGAFISGALGVALHLTYYVPGLSPNFTLPLRFVGDSTENFVLGIVAGVVAIVITFVATWFLGFTKDELEHGPVSERS